MNWNARGTMRGGIKHLSGCACPLCDPAGAKLKARRAAFLAERKAPASAPPAAPPPRLRLVRLYAPADDTRRFAELLRAGKTRVQAFAIIEAEKTTKGTP